MKPTVLVVHPGSIGDVLLARPALQGLRAAYPSCALGLLARQDIGAVLLAGREIDALFSLDGDALTGLLAGVEAVPPVLKAWLESCRLAVCWMKDPGGLDATLKACGVSRTVIQPSSSGSAGVHQSDCLRQTLTGIVRHDLPEVSLKLSQVVRAQARATLRGHELFGRPFIVLHPGSGSPHKCVAPGILASVTDGIQTQVPAVLVAGPADMVRAQDVLKRCITNPLVLEGHDLLSVAGLIAEAALFIGHDSGLTHLAAALGVPTLALFGPTDAGRWAPRGAHVTVLTGATCRCISWEEVRKCEEKPCLGLDPNRILSACWERLFAPQGSNRCSNLSRPPLPCSPL